MIQKEFRDAVFKFVRYTSVNEVSLYILIWLKWRKVITDRRSDIDVLVVFDTDNKDFEKIEARTKISEYDRI